MIELRPVRAEDADLLFPLIDHSPVTDTLLWDGPESLEGFREGLKERAEQVDRGEKYLFTIFEAENGQPIGSADIRPDTENFRGSIGLWIGIPYQGQGYGTQTIACLAEYGFETLGMEKIEAGVFVGNWASRGAHEKNGFLLEGTIRKSARKRGMAVDEWLLGLTREDYFQRKHAVILHLCREGDWHIASKSGVYRTDSLEKEGFIHCSTPDQVVRSANAYFPEVTDLVMLSIDVSKVSSPIRWERAEEQVYPHIYGPVNLGAVQSVNAFSPDPDGIFRNIPKS